MEKIKKNLPLISYLLFALTTVAFLVLVGFNIWFIVLITLWIIYLGVYITKKINLKWLKPEWSLVGLAILVVISVFLTTSLSSNTNNKQSSKKLTPEECAPIYGEYNEKVVKYSADGLQGTAGVTIDKETCEAKVNYNFLFTANLPRNHKVADVDEWMIHEYSGGLIRPDEKRESSDGQSMVDAVYENKSTLPNPFDFGFGNATVDSYNPTRDEYRDSDTFYTGWASSYVFSEERWNKLKEYTRFEVTDAAPYVVTTATDDGGESSSTDYDKSFQEGSIVATFELTIFE